MNIYTRKSCHVCECVMLQEPCYTHESVMSQDRYGEFMAQVIVLCNRTILTKNEIKNESVMSQEKCGQIVLQDVVLYRRTSMGQN